MFCCRYEIDSKLFCEEKVEAIYVLKKSGLSIFEKEGLTNEGGGSPSQRLTFL